MSEDQTMGINREELPTPSEAREILSRFNASHFNLVKKEHARYRIPADPKHDDDIRLSRFIDRAEALAAAQLECAKLAARLHWLHDCSAGTIDAAGCEWGIYRVKWENGKAVEVWQTTNSDFSDLDAEMARESSKLSNPSTS